MKIRIKGNSIRFRLTRSDVSQLDTAGKLTETVDFGDRKLYYSIYSFTSPALTANYNNDEIIVKMPQTMLAQLVQTDQVGFSGTHGAMHILIEKDFTCLDNVEEDQSDNYPNPLLKAQK